MCNVAAEIVVHSIFTCSFARFCWNMVGIFGIVQECRLFSEWLTLAFTQYKGDESSLIVMMYWSIWKCANEVV